MSRREVGASRGERSEFVAGLGPIQFLLTCGAGEDRADDAFPK